MKVGIINNQSNTVLTKKSKISFQQRQILNPLSLGALHKDSHKPKLFTSIRQVMKVLSKTAPQSKPKIVINPIDELKVLSVNLKSKNVIIQNKAIKKIFELYTKDDFANKNAISKFVWNEMIPFIQKSNDKNLANSALNIHKGITEKRNLFFRSNQSDLSIMDRIKLIEAIGNDSHLKELESYMGKQRGIHGEVKNDDVFDSYTGLHINNAANDVLMNLQKKCV